MFFLAPYKSIMKKLITSIFCASTLSVLAQSIATFSPIYPGKQTDQLQIPTTHSFQLLIKTGDALTAGGTMPTNSDFTGYVPIEGSSTNGYLSVNSEFLPGGVTILDINYDQSEKLWNVSSSGAVSFQGSLATAANCSGGVTPWGTVITCEETDVALDLNFDGYYDYGWNIEIDPATRQIRQINGQTDKLRAMGAFKHENVCIASDRKTAYYGNDAENGILFKFIADEAENLTSGTLWAMQISDFTAGTGSWIQVPNTSKTERNKVIENAVNLEATVFDRIEDAEIGPDGKIYFTVTAYGKIFRFKDEGTTISEFETYVDNIEYDSPSPAGTSKAKFQSPDNLAFDTEGNLWVNQDGGNNHIWVIRNGHSAATPKVEVFANTPRGSEPTGITFSPDGKFMFISIQHPASTNAANQADSKGTIVNFDKDATLVISRNEYIKESDHGINPPPDNPSSSEEIVNFPKPKVYPNPTKTMVFVENVKLGSDGVAIYKLLDSNGQLIKTGFAESSSFSVSIEDLPVGFYNMIISANGCDIAKKFAKE